MSGPTSWGRWFVTLALVVGLVLTSRDAHAYAWMIRHGYANCGGCHTDPSGADLLTTYGRAQSEVLLSSRWGKSTDEDVSKFSGSLFGLLPANEAFDAGGWLRNGYYWAEATPTNGPSSTDNRFLQMRAELAARATFARVVLYGTIGAANADASQVYPEVLVTDGPGWNVVSREYWAGYQTTDSTLLRVGRMNLPFGLRIPEHTAFVRAYTRTDYNQSQDDGASFAYSGDTLRGEVMAVAGNYQLGPDAYRDRGYAGYVNWHLAELWSAGLSSSVLHAETDILLGKEATRQAHGLFVRGALKEQIAVMAEADVLVTTLAGQPTRAGAVGFAQLDLEPWQGIHAIAIGEFLQAPEAGATLQTRGWLGAAWFPISHLDVRLDGIFQPASGITPESFTLLGQLNVYL